MHFWLKWRDRDWRSQVEPVPFTGDLSANVPEDRR
jgi:hypothetical protein